MTTGVDPFEFLASLGVAEPAAVVPVLSGYGDSAIWRVEVATPVARTYALRLFPAGRDGMYHREAAAMRAARRQGIPVPAIHAAVIRDGRPAMLLDWCPGRTMLEELMAHPERAWALGTLLGTVHGNLHLCATGSDLAEHGNDWLAWAGPEEQALRERLRQVVARGDASRPAILHLDLHPANVLVRVGRVTGVIDWANADVGDIRADVARTATILRFAPVDPAAPRAQLLRLRRLFRRGWRLAHRRIIGDLAEMELFDAWALAVMLRDLGAKLDRPDPGLTEADLQPIRRALERRKARLRLG